MLPRGGGVSTYTVTTLPGKLSAMKRDEYDRDTTMMRATALKELVVTDQGPRAFYLKHIAKVIPPSESDDLLIGTLFHEWVLEDRKNWAVATMARNDSHKAYQEFKAANAGKEFITAKQEALLCGMYEGLMRNRQAREIVEMQRHEEQVVLGAEEVDFVGVDGEPHSMLVPSKCAIDAWPFKNPPKFDCPARFCIKSDAAVDGWEHTVFRRGYHVQAAWYERLVHSVPEFADTPWSFAHIVVEKKPPFYCYVRPLSEGALRIGNKDCELALYRYCWGKRAEELGRDPLDAWPDLVEQRQGDPVMPTTWVNEAFGVRHSIPMTSNEPVAFEEGINGHDIPASPADYYRQFARSAG